MNKIKELIINGVRSLGYDIVKSFPAKDTMLLINSYKIDLVIDVGANEGQYAMFLKKAGYKDIIHSFEPLSQAYSKLEVIKKKYPNWFIYNVALGREESISEINVSANSVSSSILEITSTHTRTAPQAVYTSKEKIFIKTLDSFSDRLNLNKKNVFLKIDAQGFEKNVLMGAEKLLPLISTIQLEMSTTPLYSDEPLFFEMSKILYEKGFRLVKIIPGISDKQNGEILQFDGIFHKE